MEKNLKKSLIHHFHEANGASFVEANGCVDNYGMSSEQQKDQFGHLGLIDLTTFNRHGFKGRDTIATLKSQAIDLPENPNTAIRLDNGALVAKLSSNEFLFLNNYSDNDPVFNKFENATMQDGVMCYQLPRANSHFWFLLTGSNAEDTLSKLSAIDFADYSVLQLAQTSIARVNGIIIKDKCGDTPVFHILADMASSEYMWHCLLDAIEEFNGKYIGVSSLA